MKTNTVDALAQRQNLADLQAESLGPLALFLGAIGYLWMMLVLWTVTGKYAPPIAWLGGVVLLLSTVFAFSLRKRRPRVAAGALAGGVFLAVACALPTLRSPHVAYLFALPIVFAGMVVDQRAVVVETGGACVFASLISVCLLGQPAGSIDVWLPVIAILLVGIASWLSARNLYTALDWAWNGYEQVYRNEQMARNGQAELRRALKALDEATYRLERSNHMLALARDQAEEGRRLKQQFAQTISHELRTPLNLIVGFTELLARSPEYYGSPLSPAHLRDLSIVHRNACHLQTLVNDVLDLARIEAAQMSLAPEEVDPKALVEEAVETARSLVEVRGLELRAEIEVDLPRLSVDPTRIRQVLYNLLSNAARYTEQGGVTVSVRRQDEDVLFAVADTGVGIAPEDTARIFEEFQQADASTRRRHGGAGLGLAICRQFVELHGGRIWVESEVNRGSTFYFVLPAEQTDALHPVVSRVSELRNPIAVRGREDAVLLAVSRSPAAAALMARYVRGVRTVTVTDLAQAAHTARELIPQAVVIDRTSEPVDPAELERLAQEWGLPQTPFLLCPLPGEEALRQSLAVNGYLIKPVARQNLWDTLRQFGERIDRVLVIDDDQDFVLLLSRMLEDNPIRRYQVLSARNGQDGLAMVQRRRPDLVLLDLMLPDLDGYQILARIRSLPNGQDIPVVIVSAQDELDSRGALHGSLTVASAQGLRPGDIVRWVQNVVDSVVTLAPATPAPPAAPARRRASAERPSRPGEGPSASA
jgi:signal transduction histidine kinase/CheY-like chemotaxis protein